MGEAIAFYALAAFILGFAVLVVTTKNTVHSVLFLVVKAMNKLTRKEAEAPKPAEQPADVRLLTEIRDLLASSRNKSTA